MSAPGIVARCFEAIIRQLQRASRHGMATANRRTRRGRAGYRRHDQPTEGRSRREPAPPRPMRGKKHRVQDLATQRPEPEQIPLRCRSSAIMQSAVAIRTPANDDCNGTAHIAACRKRVGCRRPAPAEIKDLDRIIIDSHAFARLGYVSRWTKNRARRRQCLR